jgi:hypothetical protein
MADVKQTPPSQPVTKKGMSTGAKVGIGIGIGCCVIILIIIGLILGGVWKIGNTVQKKQNYANQFTEIADNINNALRDFDNGLNVTLKKSPNFDSSDYNSVDKNQKIIQDNYDRLVKLDVPQDYQEIQNLYEQGIKDYLDGMKIYRTGLQSKNINDFQKSSDLFKQGQSKLEQAKKKLDEKNK